MGMARHGNTEATEVGRLGLGSRLGPSQEFRPLDQYGSQANSSPLTHVWISWHVDHLLHHGCSSGSGYGFRRWIDGRVALEYVEIAYLMSQNSVLKPPHATRMSSNALHRFDSHRRESRTPALSVAASPATSVPVGHGCSRGLYHRKRSKP